MVHWILLLYRTIKSVITICPLQLQSAQLGALTGSDFVSVVRHVVATDVASTTSSVGQRIRRNGGLRLAQPLAAKTAES